MTPSYSWISMFLLQKQKKGLKKQVIKEERKNTLYNSLCTCYLTHMFVQLTTPSPLILLTFNFINIPESQTLKPLKTPLYTFRHTNI